jgi:8-oxo-dGTP pyrophosphatase MutT (NUDIX family)
MTMKKFYVGVKALIKEERGFLLLKHNEGHWDIPGGRIDGNEDFADTIRRELSEEVPGTDLISVGELQGTFRLPKDIDGDISLVLLYFLVEGKVPQDLVLGDEHESFLWVKTELDIPSEGLNPQIDKILRKLLK